MKLHSISIKSIYQSSVLNQSHCGVSLTAVKQCQHVTLINSSCLACYVVETLAG